MFNKKICLRGEFGVGKTSLVRRFVHDLFSDDYITTLGVKVTEKVLPPIEKNGKPHQYRFMIWDIAGTEEGRIQHESYWTGASGALIVADLCRPDTFAHAKKIMDHFLAINPGASVVIAGNKADLIQRQEIAAHEKTLKEIAGEISRPVFITSAKSGLSVEESFIGLAEGMLA